ncbi:hypothetical protein LUZ63_008926 [Rhynchospora breviuscula]|uniref:F-box domain-containing protein n=1 Tax=Rhynchospora breviuscula TaxID=2022672 RepID=A0A9Q0CE21_9POAL|nr:hypothetical protein LUZ63_008926 [Rhynchospora breviuscula]
MEYQTLPLTKTSSFQDLLPINKANNDLSAFPINMLPEEMQIEILSHLQTDDTVRCESVCKKWQAGIESWASRPPLGYTPQPKKPWYFMFNSEVPYATYAYNSDKEKWIPFDIPNSDETESPTPQLETTFFSQYTLYISASRGLVCFMETRTQDKGFVFNPILKNRIKLLPKAPGGIADYCAITLSTDVGSRKYVVAMVKSHQVESIIKNNLQFYVDIHLYKSETSSWVNLHTEKFVGWHGGDSDSCVICKDRLYVVANFPYVAGGTEPFHEIVAYDLSQTRQSQKKSLARTKVTIPFPCALTCVRLQNLDGKLIMVGGLPKKGTMTLDTVAIWELCGKNLKEITRAPDDVISRFRNRFDPTFIASGCGDIVFIQSYNSRALISYDMGKNVWKIVPKTPFPVLDDNSHYFSGFCFEPLLDIVP